MTEWVVRVDRVSGFQYADAYLDQGAHFAETFTYHQTDQNSPVVDVTGWAARLKITRLLFSADPLILSLTSPDGVIVGDTAGTFSWDVPAGVMAAFGDTAYDYELTVIPGGDEDLAFPLLKGKVIVRPQVEGSDVVVPPGPGASLWQAAGDLVVGTGPGTAHTLPLGPEGYVATSSGGTVVWAAPTGGGGGGAVDSVNAQTGVVVLTAADVGADASGAAAAAQSAAQAASDPLGAAAAAQAAAIAASQPLDSDLTAIAALTTTSFGRSLLTQADAAALRTTAGLGTAATHPSTDFDATGAAAAAQAASQPLDSDLTAIAALTTTSFGRSFLALADAAAGRTLLGLGTAATHAATDFDTAGAAAAVTPTTLGLVIGTNVQAHDADLDTIAALDSATAGALVTDGSGWFRKTYAQLKTALGITTGDVSGLGTAATHPSTDFAPSSGIAPSAITGTAVVTGDSRLSDARTPTGHHTSHETGGSDAIAALSGAVITTGTVAIARIATGTPDGTKFVRDDGTLAVPTSAPDPLVQVLYRQQYK